MVGRRERDRRERERRGGEAREKRNLRFEAKKCVAFCIIFCHAYFRQEPLLEGFYQLYSISLLDFETTYSIMYGTHFSGANKERKKAILKI